MDNNNESRSSEFKAVASLIAGDMAKGRSLSPGNIEVLLRLLREDGSAIPGLDKLKLG